MANVSGPPVPVLRPGPLPQMLGEAIQHLRSLPRDADARADAFVALAGLHPEYSTLRPLD